MLFNAMACESFKQSQHTNPQAPVWKYSTEPKIHSIKLSWNTKLLEIPDLIEGYEIKFRDKENENFNPRNTMRTEDKGVIIKNLKSDTLYEFKIFYILEDESLKFLNFEERTKKSYLQPLISTAPHDEDNRHIYLLKPVKDITEGNLRDVHIISPYELTRIRDGTLKEKTILFLGATGSGKSTMVDAMMNYISGVSLREDYRLKITPSTEDEQTSDQSVSQTKRITCYRIPEIEGFKIKFQLNIIDTPGFVDTRGREFDEKIPIELRKLFETVIQTLDAVCIVLPSSAVRLTEAQEYTFSSIMKLFAKDIEYNIFPMITHDDGGNLACLDALKKAKIPFDSHFRFNNSDIFEEKANENIWNERKENFKMFFNKLQTVRQQGLEDSRTVLRTLRTLRIKLERIQEEICEQVQKANTIKQEKEMLLMHQEDIQKNRDFKYTRNVFKTVETESKERCLNCPKCVKTCHIGCWFIVNIHTGLCYVFKNGKCTVCKDKCGYEHHKTGYFKYYKKTQKEERTSKKLKRQYETAVDGACLTSQIVKKGRDKMETSLKVLGEMLTSVHEMISTLNQCALKQDLTNIRSFFEDLVYIEEETKDTEYEERIALINMLKEEFNSNKPFEDIIENIMCTLLE